MTADRKMNGDANSRPELSRGVFVVFEGIDGAGKTTQAFRLKQWVLDRGLAAVYVKEPTDGPWGQKIRAIAQNGRDGIAPEDELEYFIRDRDQDVKENIAPALNRGEVVIGDRYFYSTIAYQSALGLDPEDIRRRNAAFPVPDMVFILDIGTRTSQIRITQGRREQANQGYEQEAFLKVVKTAFDQMNDPNIVRLNGEEEPDVISEEIRARMGALLSPLLSRPDTPAAQSGPDATAA